MSTPVAGCTALLLAEPLHPPPSAPVAERSVNSCMAGGQKKKTARGGQRGEEREEVRMRAHFKCKAGAGEEFIDGGRSWHRLRQTHTHTVRHKAGKGENSPDKENLSATQAG